MAHPHVPTLQPDRLNLGAVGARLGVAGLFIGAPALCVAAWIGLRSTDPLMKSHFYHSYLAAFAFFMALTLGALFFVMLHHLARAGWSVTVRRLAEGLALNIFLMVFLLVPIIAGVAYLLPWVVDPDLLQSDPLLAAKIGYLTPTFFKIRVAAYFIFWCFLAWFYASKSAQQDHSGEPRISLTLEGLAAPAMILFGFTLTAFAFDWIMALNPHWFSTIFGVYIFAGCVLSALSAIVLLALALQRRGLIGPVVNHEHYHDLGKLMFAFTFFWGYIAFSQYMLQWYANIPEETQFWIPRQIGRWGSISLLLLFVHLVIPFPGLLSRHVKRKNGVIAFWAVWCLCACALDIYWLVVPNQWISRIPEEVGHPQMPLQYALYHLVDSTHNIYALHPDHAAFAAQLNYPFQTLPALVTALCFVGIGGLYVFSTMLALRGKSLVPTRDPRLDESLAFENI